VYSTCLFCNEHLGTNDAVERCPVGRRLAFDAAKGRLWVVCRTCERWNLTPLEERWEAIEECERRFRDTRLRVSTDNIGLARVREGLELVRVGPALRPEFAAWRYGDQFGRRRRRHLLLTGAGMAVAGGVLIAGPLTGVIAGGSWAMLNVGNTIYNMLDEQRVRVRLRVGDVVQPLVIRKRHLRKASLVAGSGGAEWSLRLAYAKAAPWWTSRENVRRHLASFQRDEQFSTIELSGPQALRAAGALLPHLNSTGAGKSQVQIAVRLIEHASDPMELFRNHARLPPHFGERGITSGGDAPLGALPAEVRLALEMAAHEESERRALDGELALLDAAWREAEEIAAIADNLLVPEPVSAWLEKNKGVGGAPVSG
jgi:hypothetical protein